jgi:hypothetical protein
MNWENFWAAMIAVFMLGILVVCIIAMIQERKTHSIRKGDTIKIGGESFKVIQVDGNSIKVSEI